MGCRKLAQGVRSYQDRVTSMNDTALHNSAHHRSYEWNRECIVDMEFEWRSSVVMSVVGQYIQECSHEIEAFSSDVGDLEDGTYPLADELRGGVDGIFAVLDENGDFAGSGGFQDACQLRDGLL